jgi:thiamine-phosphate pyrophosphorylase
VFPTATKGYATPQPAGALAAAIARSTVPVFAIGGITPENAAQLRIAGAEHVAVSAAILRAADPAVAARSLRTTLLRR